MYSTITMARQYRNYTDEDIIQCSKKATSMSSLLKMLGLRQSGGNFIHMRKNLQRLNLSCDHWTGQAWSKDKRLKNWQDYTKVVSLKYHLEQERGRKCEKCGLSHWLEQLITLEVHHIDGNRTNNEYDNLSLLCCNCHAVTDNWRNKKTIKSK